MSLRDIFLGRRFVALLESHMSEYPDVHPLRYSWDGFGICIQPLPPGQKRKREDWELMWYFGMFGAMAFTAVGMYYKPDTRFVSVSHRSSEPFVVLV